VRVDANRSRISALLPWLPPLLLLLGVQTFQAFREPIFSPIDELPHTDYVRTIAETARLPVYGDARTDLILLSIYYHEYPSPVTAEQLKNPPHPANAISYEALQLPLFYLVAAPVYRALDFDPRVAIYGVRMLNVLLSAVLLVLMVQVLRRIFPLRRRLAMLMALVLLLIPGVSIRNSQVTNQVLATLLVTLLLYLLVRREMDSPGPAHSFTQGAVLGLAVLAKLTALGALPALLLAWLRRRKALGWGLAAGAGGFILVTLPWLAWSLPTYGHPIPFMARHLAMWPTALFAAPATAAGWLDFATHVNHYFWLPWDWQTTGGLWEWVLKIPVWAGFALLVAALASGIIEATSRRSGIAASACRLALLMVIGFAVGYVALAFGLNRFWPTDGRELYVFIGALAVLFGSLAVRLRESVGLALFGGLLVAWLLVDVGFYLAGGSCFRCYPA
jgi:4-amino-4-deoxy-L-arabinose transferase-like glycosyltransferase